MAVNRSFLIRGLEIKGYAPFKSTERYDGYAHPKRGQRYLWVGKLGNVRVGKTATASEPVHQDFINHTINLGIRSAKS